MFDLQATASFPSLDTRKTGQLLAEAEPGRKLNQHGPEKNEPLFSGPSRKRAGGERLGESEGSRLLESPHGSA